MVPDEIVDIIDVPGFLADDPYLSEYHGSSEHIIKGIFNYYMGWFSGESLDLHPMNTVEEAQKIVELAEGPERILEAIQQSIDTDEYGWALELCECLNLANSDESGSVVIKVKY